MSYLYVGYRMSETTTGPNSETSLVFETHMCDEVRLQGDPRRLVAGQKWYHQQQMSHRSRSRRWQPKVAVAVAVAKTIISTLAPGGNPFLTPCHHLLVVTLNLPYKSQGGALS